MKIFNNKKSFGILLFSMVATNSLTYYYTTKKETWAADVSESSSETSKECDYDIKRKSGFSYIKPILYVDTKCESDHLSSVKQSVNDMIENYKKIEVINSASVYIKELNGSGWTAVNGDEEFMPGSLMKVPELIAYLKMNEIKPGILDKVITFNKAEAINRSTNFNSKSIQLGHSYTIRELLKYMINYSDNNATALLNKNIDMEVFKKVFTDLNLPAPDWSAKTYPITAKEFTVFMRALYNGTYLNDENSEIATKLLSQCDFKQGMIAGLPANTKVAHKFGESGTQSEQQLSESAIVYLDNNPYTITIMTKGKDYKKLPQVIKEISSTVYQQMLQK
jgi:beta-lactamase class A